MRKRLLGTIAAVTAGAGAAVGQAPAPPPPAPLAPAGAYPGTGIEPAFGAYNTPVAPPVPGYAPSGPGYGPQTTVPNMGMGGGMPGMGMPGPGMGMPGMGMGMGGDPYGGGPPAPGGGVHGEQLYETLAPAGGGGGGSGGAGAASRFFFNGQYVLWFVKSQPTRTPYVTTSAPSEGGVLGQSTTTILFPRPYSVDGSNGNLGYNLFSGFKLDGGYFYDDARRNGVYASGFLLEQKANIGFFSSDATGQPLIARPFVDVSTGLASAQLVSSPTFVSGSIAVITRSRAFGAEGGPITNLYRSCPGGGGQYNLDLLTAFRWLELDETLDITSRSTLLSNSADFDGKLELPPASIEVRDHFTARNSFYGGQAGLSGGARNGRYSFGLTTKLALGDMHEIVDVQGTSSLIDPSRGVASTVPGGLYANAANIGRYKEDKFAVIPEITATLGYNWTSRFYTSIGYNYIYVSRVARPGEQFTPIVNPNIVPTSFNYGRGTIIATPNPAITQGDFWLQGVNFGLNLSY